MSFDPPSIDARQFTARFSPGWPIRLIARAMTATRRHAGQPRAQDCQRCTLWHGARPCRRPAQTARYGAQLRPPATPCHPTTPSTHHACHPPTPYRLPFNPPSQTHQPPHGDHFPKHRLPIFKQAGFIFYTLSERLRELSFLKPPCFSSQNAPPKSPLYTGIGGHSRRR